MKKNLELRAYSIVLYQLSDKQKCIQGLHATIEYGVVHGMDKNSIYYDWAKNWKTVIVLDGGTSDTLANSIEYLKLLGVPHVTFKEPDLYNQITSVSFIIDERIFDKKNYPDFIGGYLSVDEEEFLLGKWVDSVGGITNMQLREFLQKFRLA